MDLLITILPVVTKDLPISPRFTPYNFLSRCKFSTFTTRQPMVAPGHEYVDASRDALLAICSFILSVLCSFRCTRHVFLFWGFAKKGYTPLFRRQKGAHLENGKMRRQSRKSAISTNMCFETMQNATRHDGKPLGFTVVGTPC